MCEKIGAGEVALLLIAGGQSARMGEDKRFLAFGGETLLERLLKKAAGLPFRERFLCVESATDRLKNLAHRYGYTLLADELQGQGPAEGLRRGLSAMEREWGFALSCDMPFFSFAVLEKLLAHRGEAEAIIPVAGGRRQMLAGLYHKGLAACFEMALGQGERKLAQIVKAPALVELPEEFFFNVNTPADARLARGRLANEARRTPVLSIVAPVSGTGKTTFLEKLVARLSARGLRVAAIKSDAHGFSLDVEGKDTARFTAAGAAGVAIVSPTGWMLEERTEERLPLEAVAEKFQAAGLILTESRTHGTCPAFSLWRGKGEPMTGEAVAALFAGGEGAEALRVAQGSSLATYDLDDLEAAERLACFLLGDRNGGTMEQEQKLTHFSEAGEAIMVDVSGKAETDREAVASGRITMNEAAWRALSEGTSKKGDVLGVARIAGIMAAKRTSEAIPLCHPLPLAKCSIDFEQEPATRMVIARARVKTRGVTGVEMEALHAVSVTLLTIYDMLKAVDKRMELRDIHLDAKTGGKSGIFRR